MRYFALAILLFVVGVYATTLRLDPRPYHPVVRVRTGDGFFMTLVQAGAKTQAACMKTINDISAPLARACPSCVVESADCSHELSGIDKALAEGAEVPLYRVEAEGVNMALVGPPSLVRERCERIAAQMVAHGMKSASCSFPKPGAAASRAAEVVN